MAEITKFNKLNEDEVVTNDIIEDNFFRLTEMHEAMCKSIDNARKVCAEQNELVEVLKEAKTTIDFTEFIESTLKQNIDLHTQIDVLKYRAELLMTVINEAKDDEKMKDVVNKLLIALGVFSR